jgi:hypothetical protein
MLYFFLFLLLIDICRLLIHAVAHGDLKCWMQMQNYQKKMEQKIQREDDLRSGLRLYKSVKHRGILFFTPLYLELLQFALFYFGLTFLPSFTLSIVKLPLNRPGPHLNTGMPRTLIKESSSSPSNHVSPP